MTDVLISAKSMRQRFNGCEPDYIRDVCKGACCRASNGTISVALAPIEVRPLLARGALVDGLFMQPRQGEHRCPFQAAGTNLCELHQTPDKPFGCIASPFSLTSKDTLVVRNRYRLLKCYNDGERIPAYVAFGASLRLLFGIPEAARIAARLDDGSDDLIATMLDHSYATLRAVVAQRHGRVTPQLALFGESA